MPDGSALALKIMAAADNRITSKEIRSVQMVRQLSHANLIRIDRVWTYLNYVVFAMELAEGSLDDLLSAYRAETGGPVAPLQACLLLGQVADALDFLNARRHEVGGQLVAIQHCDVKPSNMLLFGDTVKLSDFGLASMTTGRVQFHRRAGTAAYAAPEVFMGRLSDKADQYGLAVSYCELRGGRLPFPDTPSALHRSYIRPKPDLTMVSARERSILVRALDPVPQNRWSTSGDFMSQLTALVG
jgi:serine/threonine protein kinase